MKGSFGHGPAPLMIEMQILFHLNQLNKVDYARIQKVFADGQKLKYWPAVPLKSIIEEVRPLKEKVQTIKYENDELDSKLIVLHAEEKEATADRESVKAETLKKINIASKGLQILEESLEKMRPFQAATGEVDIMQDSGFDENIKNLEASLAQVNGTMIAYAAAEKAAHDAFELSVATTRSAIGQLSSIKDDVETRLQFAELELMRQQQALHNEQNLEKLEQWLEKVKRDLEQAALREKERKETRKQKKKFTEDVEMNLEIS